MSAKRIERREYYNSLTGPAIFLALALFGVLVITAWSAIPTIATITLWCMFGMGVVAGLLGIALLFVRVRNEWIEGNKLRPVDELGNYEAVRTRKGVVHLEPYNKPQGAKITHISQQNGQAATQAGLAALPENPLIESPVTPLLPETVHFDAMIGNWRPSVTDILLALGPGGERFSVHAQELCHVALAGITGGGKSNLMRFLLAQLLSAGAKVVLADPHYTPYDAESGEDWRPIEQRLFLPPAVSMDRISFVLTETIKELDKRLQLRYEGKPCGAPFFLAIDELPVIAAALPDQAPADIARIVREGRKVHLLLITAAQDWLVKTIGADSGAVRNNFRTAFYVGGDQTTGRVLLDLPTGKAGAAILNDTPLGKGVALMRSKATPRAMAVRVPLVSNEALYRLLGPARPAQPQQERSYGTTRPGAVADTSRPDIVINGRFRTLPETTEPPKQGPRLPKKGTRLYDAWQAWQGGNTSKRKLAKALECSATQAFNYIQELKQRGLIGGQVDTDH